jgi:anti-sigma-K factor RskA
VAENTLRLWDMAQTKRKRQTKHRGNAAGVVESRGRTGRRPTAAERSPQGREKAQAKERREQRYDRPPTWRGAFFKALAAAAFLTLIVGVLIAKKPGQAGVIFPLGLVLYLPISYYMDLWAYRRRLRKKASQRVGMQ